MMVLAEWRMKSLKEGVSLSYPLSTTVQLCTFFVENCKLLLIISVCDTVIRSLRQVSFHEFKPSLGYIVRPLSQNQTPKRWIILLSDS